MIPKPTKMDSLRVTVFESEEYDRLWPLPGYQEVNLPNFIMWLQNEISKIPEEYRNRSFIEIDSVAGYEDSHYPTIEIYYYRPETDEEYSVRLKQFMAQELSKERDERALLQTLKLKYND